MNRPKRAALYYVPAGYSTSGPELMGINAASEGFLRALIRYGDLEDITAVSESPEVLEPFREFVRAANPKLQCAWTATAQMEHLADVGALFLPGPGLGEYAWMRRRVGSREFSLCGVTHTTATPLVLDALADLHVAPVEPWDAVVCPSHAVRRMVVSLLDDHALYLKERFGVKRVTRPELPVIPLGVETGDFAPDARLRVSWRARLGFGQDEVAVLFMGRLSPMGKAHPIPMFMAMEAAARRTRRKLTLILAGWFQSDAVEATYRNAAAEICPSVNLVVLDGRLPAVREGVWRAADIFLSPVDNIQETFGLTPLEAMSAGLPVVASDWDGYRESVRHGVDGFLARTLAPGPGGAVDLATAYGARTADYGDYIGVSAQAVAVSIPDIAQAIATLADDPLLRSKMGDQGMRRARELYDWSRVIPVYQDLWANLAVLRGQAQTKMLASPYPARPDPFTAFQSYPSGAFSRTDLYRVGSVVPEMVDYLVEHDLIGFMRGLLPPAGEIVHVLQEMERLGRMSGIDMARRLSPSPVENIDRLTGWLLKYDFIRLADAN